MSAKEITAVAAVLSDPENSSRTAEEVAELAIAQLDDIRARTHRLAVVGQIAFPEAPETAHTVVLGPFSSRGILDTREKFLKAVAGPSRARTVGQDMLADPKTGRGRGQFFLAPAFQRPRDAWDFYRAEEWRDRIPKGRLENIQAAVTRWEAGLWATEVAPGPVCHCGAHTERTLATSAGPVKPGPCPVHGRREE